MIWSLPVAMRFLFQISFSWQCLLYGMNFYLVAIYFSNTSAILIENTTKMSYQVEYKTGFYIYVFNATESSWRRNLRNAFKVVRRPGFFQNVIIDFVVSFNFSFSIFFQLLLYSLICLVSKICKLTCSVIYSLAHLLAYLHTCLPAYLL